MPEIKTLVINNFGGPLTRKLTGDINSGLANFDNSYGYDPFSKPGTLTFLEQPTSIITLTTTDGPISGLKVIPRADTINVYGVTEKTGKVYKVQVNDVGTTNPNYDTASVISQFTDGEDFFKSCSIQPYGASIAAATKLYVGGDNGVSKVFTNGTVPSFVGAITSYQQDVPRPLALFLGKLYFGNRENIGEIDSTETVTTYYKLSPGFPSDCIVRDLDVTPDGNYLQITVSKTNQVQLDGLTLPNLPSGNEETYKFYWNGTDASYTSYETYGGYSLTSNTIFGSKNFTTGYDLGGTALYDGSEKILSFPKTISPNFSAMFSVGNLVGFATTMYDTSVNHFKGDLYFYGKYDNETQSGLYRFLRYSSGQGTEVNLIPTCTPVSNTFYAPTWATYPGNVASNTKLYFSSSESKTIGATTFYGPLYKFNLVPTGSVSALAGVYQTQAQLFSKKVNISEVRVYGEPWVASNAFTIDLIGSNQSSIAGASYTFSTSVLGVGVNATASTVAIGQDYAWYNPQHKPTYAVGLKVTNVGLKNLAIHKVEIDYSFSGK